MPEDRVAKRTIPQRREAAAELSAPAARARPALSVTDFLTDGSLAALCDQLTLLTGLPVRLCDPAGRLIVPASGPRPWAVVERDPSAPAPPGTRIPLVVEGKPIGSIVLEGGRPALPAEPRPVLERTLTLLSHTAAELCQQALELRHRVREIEGLFRLSGLLARATDVDRVLQIALDMALDVLEMDAGSVVLFDRDVGVIAENEADLVIKASRNLSRDWLENPTPASKGRVFDRLALGGELVTSSDLQKDDRVLLDKEVVEEGLRGFINAGLMFQDRPIGVIRLYSRGTRSFDDADKRILRSIAAQAAVAVEQARLMKLQEQDARMQRQVQLAADVQRRMLPRRMPSFPRLDLAARYVPSFELGGDFYDLIELGSSLGLAIGDVVGKGIAAALLMASVRASLRAHVQDVYDIDEVMSRVNAALCRDTLDNEFATLWYGVIDPATLRLTYCSGGHEPPLVVRAKGRGKAVAPAPVEELSVGGMVVGVDPTYKYAKGLFDLKPGDTLVAYTDGVTDATNFQREKFGKKRLREAVVAAAGESPRAPASHIAERIFWELRQFAGLSQRPDDQTVVVLRVRP